MKPKFILFILITFLFLWSENSFPRFLKKEHLKAYLKISIQNPGRFKDSTAQNIMESKIKDVFKDEGVEIISAEKPDIYEEYKLYININIKDSLEIDAKGMSCDMSIITVKYPRLNIPYKNETDIYNSVKNYIKQNIIRNKK